jgi:hypothetical protein
VDADVPEVSRSKCVDAGDEGVTHFSLLWWLRYLGYGMTFEIFMKCMCMDGRVVLLFMP